MIVLYFGDHKGLACYYRVTWIRHASCIMRMKEKFLRVYALHLFLYFLSSKLFLGKVPWWFLLPTQLRNSIIIPLELPTFYPGRFRWDNRDTAASTQCHSYNSATCGSKRDSNSPPVTETTKKVHRSKGKWCRYNVTKENCTASWSEATKPTTCW